MSSAIIECRKHGMRQDATSGKWILAIELSQADVPLWLFTAPLKQRMALAELTIVADEQNQERPAQPATQAHHPAPDAVSPGGGKQEGAAPAPKPKRKWEDMEIVTRAAMMCEDKRAWPIIARITGWEVENVDEAAEAVREYVKCRRREIKLYPLAVARFEGIETEYLRATRP